jgi:hypothetical protein
MPEWVEPLAVRQRSVTVIKILSQFWLKARLAYTVFVNHWNKYFKTVIVSFVGLPAKM